MANVTAADQREYYTYYFKALRLAGLVGASFFALGFIFFNLMAASAAGIVAAGLAYDRGMSGYFEVVRQRGVSARKLARKRGLPDSFDESNKIIMGGPFSIYSDHHYNPRDPNQNFW